MLGGRGGVVCMLGGRGCVVCMLGGRGGVVCGTGRLGEWLAGDLSCRLKLPPKERVLLQLVDEGEQMYYCYHCLCYYHYNTL